MSLYPALSVWKTHTSREYPILRGRQTCDVLVIGGGICGVLTAWRLAEKGLDVILCEQSKLASGRTAGSTAKATVAQGRCYSRLWREASPDAARAFARLNTAGLALLHSLCGTGSRGTAVLPQSAEPLGKRADMLLYSLHGDTQLAWEADALSACHIPCVPESPAAYPVPYDSGVRTPAAVLRIPDQLALQPVALTEAVAAHGRFTVYEHSPVLSFTTGEKCHAVTENGEVFCRSIVCTTGYPLRTGSSFLRLRGWSAQALLFTGCPSYKDFLYGIDGGPALRSYGSYLLVSEPAEGSAHNGTFVQRTMQAVQAMYSSASPKGILTNHDLYPHDRLPYIGCVRRGLWIAAGFSGWGMTTAAGAALALADAIVSGEGKHADAQGLRFFSPRRAVFSSPQSMDAFSALASEAIRGNLRRMTGADPTASYRTLRPGQAMEATYRGKRVGAYRHTDGMVYLVDLKCPHLGCLLQWNADSRTWDCPCHGSRYDYRGHCISGVGDTACIAHGTPLV